MEMSKEIVKTDKKRKLTPKEVGALNGLRLSHYKENFVDIVEDYLKEVQKDKDNVPMIQELALQKFNVLPTQLNHWASKYARFDKALKKVKAAQEAFLIKRVMGRYPVGAMFLLKAVHGYVDNRQEVSGDINIRVASWLQPLVSDKMKKEAIDVNPITNKLASKSKVGK